MRLRRLRIERLPGIGEPYGIEVAGPGVHVVFGPNAIGKSSICRAVEALYWSDIGPGERTYVTGEFEIDGESWRAERDGPRVRWRYEGEDRMLPGIPGSHHRRSFFLRLRDLLDPSRDGTQDIASEIRRQMWGGFDLAGIVEELFSGVTRHAARRQRNAFADAMRAVQKAETRQDGLKRRAAKRQALEAALEGASSSVSRRSAVARAVELAARAEEHAGLVRRLEAMPAVLPRLSGEELEQVERLQDQIDGWSERDRRLEGKLDAARAKRRDARLPAPIESADLAVWRERADELGRRELALTNARTELGERLEELRTALGSLGGSDLEKAAFTLDEHARLFEFLREAEDHRAGQRAIELRIKLLEKVDDEERASSEGIRPEDLRSAVETLRRWLRSPAPGEHGAGARARRMWLLSALAVMLAGAGLAWIADPRAGLLLLAAGAGLIAPVLLMGRARRDGAARAEAEAAFARLGIPPPDAWDVPSTEARLRTLEEAVARVKREELRAVDQQGLKSDLSALAEKAAVLDGTRKRLLEDLGLAAMSPDAELVDTARALDRLRGARIAHERAAGRVKDFEGTYSGLLADLAAFLREHGEREPEDASSAKAYLGRLADRNAQLEAAISRERQAASERKSLAADRKAARRSTRQIYEKASLDDGDLPVLRDLVSQLEDFRTLHRTVFGLESQNKGDREALEEAGELGLAELDEASLRRLEEVLLADAERAEKLRKKLAGIDAEVKEARRAGSLQDLIARQEEARAELRERRDEVIFAEAGRLLINTVEREYEQTQMPRVFERARAHILHVHAPRL